MATNATRRAAAFAAALLLSGCGYVGEPLYPALNIPGQVADLTAKQRGRNIEVSFTIPPLTTEGLVIKQIGSVELRIGPNTSGPFNADQWASSATLVDVKPPEKTGPVHVTVPLQPYVGQGVIVGVRAKNGKGRAAAWSNLVSIQVQAPLPAPADVKAQAVAQGVFLTWSGPAGASFRLLRKAQNELFSSRLATTTEGQYLDTTSEYGVTYQYWVQGIQGENESDVAGPVSIKPKDEFPPAIPAGLGVSAGLASLELAWERNNEIDFKGYRVYRATGDSEFSKVADLLEAPSFSDTKIESGKRYRYAVSAVDQAGNESQRTAPVEATAP